MATKKVLILVLSSDFEPYSKMIETSNSTWNSIDVPDTETIFYCSQKDNPSINTRTFSSVVEIGNVMYFDVPNGLYDMGHKNLAMYEWALANKEFDFVARINASCYCDKKELIKFVQTLPDENVFLGAETDSQNGFRYCWGGAQYVISRDVLQKIVDNKDQWLHQYMEDEASSLLVASLGIPFKMGYAGSIDDMGDHWRLISYGGKSITFTKFEDLIPLKHFFYRVKFDGARYKDEIVMKKLFEILNQSQ